MNINRNGLLISFEGIDGSGKSTQVSKVLNHFQSMKIPVVKYFEPTMGYWGLKARELFRTGHVVPTPEEVSYFVKDRKEDVKDNVLPALEAGKIVLMDRYFDSTIAYQGALESMTIDEILEENSFAPIPDLTLFGQLLDIINHVVFLFFGFFFLLIC